MRLVVHPGTPQAWEIQLKPGTNCLGRAFANDFQIEDPSVSGSHCQIVVNNDSVSIKDLGSTNGTFVNRAPVQEASLQRGQTIRLGNVEMLLESSAPPATPASTLPLAPLEFAPTPSASAQASAPPPAAAPIVRAVSTGPIRVATPAASPATTVVTSGPRVEAPPQSGGTVRVARTEMAPAPLVPVSPDTATAVAAGNAVCRYHPHDPARWLCGKCHKTFCDLCAAPRRDGSVMKHYCRTCGVECSELEIKVVVKEQKTFFQLLPGAFGYPFRKDGVLVFIVVGIVLVGLNFMGSVFALGHSSEGGFMLRPYSMTVHVLQFFYYGYLCAYLQNLIQSTVSGDESPPEMPAMSEFLQDILIPCFQLGMIFLVCFGLAIGLLILMAESDSGWMIVPAIGLAGLGCLFFPMAFLAVAIFDTVAALNPLLIIPSILKVPVEYLVTCVLSGVILAVNRFGEQLLNWLIPIPVMPILISGFVWLYFITVEMRILGLLYRSNKSRLGWLNR